MCVPVDATIVTSLMAIVGTLREGSSWALESALRAHGSDGAACKLVFHIPHKKDGLVEVELYHAEEATAMPKRRANGRSSEN